MNKIYFFKTQKLTIHRDDVNNTCFVRKMDGDEPKIDSVVEALKEVFKI